MKLVTSKQFALTAFVVIMAQKILILPAYMIKTGGRSSYVSMFFMLLLELAVLFVFMLTIKLAGGKSFYNLLDKGAGKAGGRVIAAVMLAVAILKALLLIGEVRAFFSINLSEPLVDFVALVPLCVYLFMVGTKTLRGVGRLSEIMSFFILLAMLVLFVFVVGHIDFKWMLPVMGEGVKPLFKNISLYPLWFADIPFMFIFLGQVKKEKRFMLWGIIGGAAGGLIALFFTTVVFMSYGNMSALLGYGGNISHMLIYSSLNYVYGRFDLIIFCIWIFAVFIQLGLVFYGATRSIKYIFKARSNGIVSVILAVFLYILAVQFFHNEYNLHSVCLMPVVRIFAGINQLLVPLFVLIVAIVINRKSKAKRQLVLGLKPLCRSISRDSLHKGCINSFDTKRARIAAQIYRSRH